PSSPASTTGRTWISPGSPGRKARKRERPGDRCRCLPRVCCRRKEPHRAAAIMTSIDFYTHVDDRLEVAAKLVAKAFAQHGSVRVFTPDAATTEELGRRLWLKPPIAFLPHCRVDSALAGETPIWVDHVDAHPGPAAVLINLR